MEKSEKNLHFNTPLDFLFYFSISNKRIIFMDKEKCKERFIKKAKQKYGNKFDYSKVVYNGCFEKICIICPEHGEFWITPNNHLWCRTGCPECGREQGAAKNTLTTEEFIERARKIHGDKYDYSKVNCNGWYSYVTIICPKHGEFTQRVVQHLTGAGCPECGKEKIPHYGAKKVFTQEYFLSECKRIYGDNLPFELLEYKTYNQMAKFTCEKHGEFYMIPGTVLDGKGCPLCRREQKFIKHAKEKYGDKYDYSKVVYKNAATPVCIIDKERGEFWQRPDNHLSGSQGNNFEFDTYDYCKKIAEKYNTLYDFYTNDKRNYYKAANKGWINDFTWLEKGKLWEDKIRLVYVYELSDGSAYVGLTNNIEHRDKTHRGIINKGSKSSLREYSIKNNIEILTPKILENNLTILEAQSAEKKWIYRYTKNGWHLINKTNGGEIGAVPEFAYDSKKIEEILEESKNYSSLCDVEKKNHHLHTIIVKLGLEDKCFPNRRKNQYHREKHNYTQEFIEELVKKYPLKNDLRKNDVGAYMYFHKHNLLDKYYPKRLLPYENNFIKR